MKSRVVGVLDTPGRPAVVLDARAERGGVVLRVARDSRRAAKLDRSITLSSGASRDLMRQLQAAADQADRLAYQADHRSQIDVSAVVEWLESEAA